MFCYNTETMLSALRYGNTMSNTFILVDVAEKKHVFLAGKKTTFGKPLCNTAEDIVLMLLQCSETDGVEVKVDYRYLRACLLFYATHIVY